MAIKYRDFYMQLGRAIKPLFFVVCGCVTSDFTPADLLERCLEIKDDDDSDLKSHQ